MFNCHFSFEEMGNSPSGPFFLLQTGEGDKRCHHHVDAFDAGVLFHIDPLIEGMRAPAVPAGIDGNGRNMKADGNVGIRAADTVGRLHSKLHDDRAGDLHNRGI